MKRSPWIVAVGILAIAIGLNGVLQGLASLASTVHQGIEHSNQGSVKGSGDDVAQNKESLSSINGKSRQESSQQYDPPLSDQAFELLGRLLADNNPWEAIRAVVYLLISGAYFLAGITLIFKSFGPRLFLWVMAVSVFWSLMQMLLYSQAEIQMLLAVFSVFAPSMAIDVTLAAIVWGVTRVPQKEDIRNADLTSSTDRGFSMAKAMNVWIPKITGISAAVFVFIFPFWLLGVPGVDNTYAQGWRMGLDVVMYYPVAWSLAFGVSWLLKKAAPPDRQRDLNIVVSLCMLLFFSLAVLRLSQAFRLIAA